MAVHPGRAAQQQAQAQQPQPQQQPQQQGGFSPNPKLAMSNQASVDEAAGRQNRIEGAYAEQEAQKEQQVGELATAIATGQIGEQELQQLPPELVQRAVEMVQSAQIQNNPAGQGIADPGLEFVEQEAYAEGAQQGAQAEQQVMGLAQAIQTGAISDQELQQLDPQMVQAAVQMLQGQGQ